MTAFGVNDLAEFAARVAELRASIGPPSTSFDYVAYTDGACFGNPRGNGGWAAVVFGERQRTWLLFGHLSSTSNNRAEALGVLAALEWIPATSSLTVYSDSQLTVQQLLGVYKVKANSDIWDLIKRTRADKQLTVRAEWVRGHAGDPFNEMADRLSKLGATNGALGSSTLDSSIQVDHPPPEPTQLDGLVPQGDWERGFVSSVRDQLRRGRPLTPKQLAVVERIRKRTTG